MTFTFRPAVRTPEGNGYYKVRRNGIQVREHVAIAELALGKRLPSGALVHHVDEDRSNNLPSNLVICPNDAYHALLHQRKRALDACGNANYRKCQFCGIYSDSTTMKYNSRMFHHAECRKLDNAKRWSKRKARK